MKKDTWKYLFIYCCACLAAMVIGFLILYNNMSWLMEENDALHIEISQDSTLITKMREDAGKTMQMLEQGSQGNDTVYYQDKKGNKFVIQFIKK